MLLALSAGCAVPEGDDQDAGIKARIKRVDYTVVYTEGSRILADYIPADGAPYGFYAASLTDGATVGLERCGRSERRCTWVVKNGMIFSSADPSLAIKGGSNLVAPTLSSSCTHDTPMCTWTWFEGMWLNMTNLYPINAYGGVANKTLKMNTACGSGNPDCTWTLEMVSIRSSSDPSFGWNALGGIYDGARIGMWGCDPGYKNCAWTFQRGKILTPQLVSSDTVYAVVWQTPGYTGQQLYLSPIRPTGESAAWGIDYYGRIVSTAASFAANAYGGVNWGSPVALYPTSGCSPTNPDCTWVEGQGRTDDPDASINWP